MSESANAAGLVPHQPRDANGLELLAEVASYLAAGLGSEEVLARVAGVLARGLRSDRCRIWVRTADGASFRAIVGEGYDAPEDRPSDEIRLDPGVHVQELSGDQWILRYPLRHEGEELGLLEAWVQDGTSAPALTRVVQIVANVLCNANP